nr:autotransporter domain-containing protein [Caulobacter sp. 17J65-9]
MAIGGDVSVDSTRIIARGDRSGGILINTANLDSFFGEGEYGATFVAGDIHVTSGTIRTEGGSADGIAVFSGYAFFGEGEYGGGDVDITSGNITTLGDDSAGIRVTAYGRYTYGDDESWEIEGDVTVHSGAVITSGDYSDGIVVEATLGDVNVTANATATSGDSSRGIDIDADNGDVVVNATAVTTTGGRKANEVSYYDSYTESWVYVTEYGHASDGIRVETEYGDVTINAQNVTVSGDQATGVLVDSEYGDVKLNLGSVRAQGEAGDAVHVYAYEGDIGVNISGQVTSANGAGVHAYSYYGGVDVKLAAGSRVQGGTVGIYAYSDTGTTITINGTVSAASGLAIDVKGLGAATIHNLSNTVIGGVSLTDNDDLFDNTGTFQATIDSQFGEGVDLFDNTGLLQILPGSSTPGTIVFQGLETFDNAGVVDLANGHAGDVFDLSSATWNGEAGSTLELDISGSGSDTLLVDDATGHTTIVLSGAGGGIGQALELVVSNSDETGNEFTLDGDTGFVKFIMDFDAATDTWSAVGTADTEVFEPGRFLTGAQNFWNETGDAWSARMTELRDIGSDRGQGAQGWVQAFGGEQSEDRGTERFTVGGAPSDVNLAYEQSYRGLQTGVDWSTGDTVLGVTIGFGDSEQRMASGNSAEFGGFNFGAYGGWNPGSFFVNGLVKADVYKTRLGLRTLQASEEVDGRTWGAKAEAGWRVGGDGWFFEPSARLSWTDVDMDGFSAAGGTVEFGDASSLLGEAGARFGTHWTNGVVDLVPYLGLFAVDEFDGENQTAFSIAGDTFRLTDEAAGAHGRVDFGVTAVTFHGLEGFVKGEALVGGDAEGYSARLGVRWRW